MQTDIKCMCVHVEQCYKDVELKMGLHFKLINFFMTLIDENADMIERYGYSNIIEPLRLFPYLFKIRTFKQCLMAFLKQVKSAVPCGN